MFNYESRIENARKVINEADYIKENPDTDTEIQDMQIGGLGIYIVKESMDNVEYKYENNKNILILSKNV